MLFGAALAGQTMPLSLERAVELAVAPTGNVRLELVKESIAQAEARERLAFGAFLPTVEGSISASSQTRNLAAFGISFPGAPAFVGPFTIVDYRASATQSILDFSNLRRYSAAKALRSASEAEAKYAREVTMAQVARLYTLALRAEAAVDAAGANVALAERVVRLANGQREAGAGTAIEVTRARVERQNALQRLLVAENERETARLELKRAIGLDLGQEISLTSKVDDGSERAPELAATLEVGKRQRADLAALERRKEAARWNLASIGAERYPSLVASGDYGSLGDGSRQLPTRAVSVGMRVPIFDGGRREARRAEAGVLLRQDEIRRKDLERQVELEIRVALSNWKVTQEQIGAARLGLELAENELAQAERRYEAGVGASVELIDARTRLERARDNNLAALYQFNLARIDLAAAAGGMEAALKGLTK